MGRAYGKIRSRNDLKHKPASTPHTAGEDHTTSELLPKKAQTLNTPAHSPRPPRNQLSSGAQAWMQEVTGKDKNKMFCQTPATAEELTTLITHEVRQRLLDGCIDFETRNPDLQAIFSCTHYFLQAANFCRLDQIRKGERPRLSTTRFVSHVQNGRGQHIRRMCAPMTMGA